MAFTPYGFTIDPAGETVIATLRRGTADGSVVRPYTSNDGTVTTGADTFEVTSQTTYYLSEPGVYFLSLKVDEVERATPGGQLVGFHLAGERSRHVAVLVPAYLRGVGGGGGATSGSSLKGWVSADAFQLTDITYDQNGVISTADVVWPDGSAGVFTTTLANGTWGTVDAFTVTHVETGRTVTQAAVTRNVDGVATVIPELEVG